MKNKCFVSIFPVLAYQRANPVGVVFAIIAMLLAGLISPLPVWGQCCVPPPQGLVSWYAGEGDASDQMGVNPGNLMGGVTFTSGEVNQAFSFDGSSGYVYIPASPSLDLGSGAGLTVECWIKPGDVSSPHVIAEWNNGVDQSGMQFWTSVVPYYGQPGSLFVNFKDTSGGSHILTSGANILNANTFQHVAITYDNASGLAVIYCNGTAVASQNIGSLTLQTTYDLYLGMRVSAGSASPYLGLMDEVSFYNRALSASEIYQIFYAGSAGKCGANSSPPPLPVIIGQPTNQSVYAGSTATFSVAATNCYLTYQWMFDAADIPGATNDTLVLTNVQSAMAGSYSVVVSDSSGSVVSTNAELTVTTNCLAPPAGIAAWWQAEGDATDGIGGNNGTIQNGVSFAPGEVGQAFDFDGTNGLITVPASTNLDLGAGSGVTFECWVNPADVSNQHVIAEWNDAVSHSGLQMWFSLSGSGSIYVNFVDTSGNSHILNTPANLLVTNEFQHVAYTYDKVAGVGKIYYNGVAQASLIAANLRLQTTYGFYMGKRVAAGAASPFKGLMDEVSLYSRALSASEIQAIYNAGSHGKCPLQAPPAIISQPQNVMASPGSNATFKATVTGTHPMSYQWLLNNVDLLGATNYFLTLTNVQPDSSGGLYSLSISNAYGTAISSNATLYVSVVSAYASNQLLTNFQYSFSNTVTITLSNYYTNGDIFYTLDGSTPDAGSTLYTGPFAVSQSSILQTLGYSPDFSQAALSSPITIQIVPFYSLSATTAGGGHIAISPTNTAPYPSGTLVSLSASPSNGWTFLQWTGDAYGTNPAINIDLSRSKSVQAVFGTKVSSTATGNGSVLFNPGGGIYPFGTSLEVSAVPLAGSYFVAWGNAATGNTNPLTFLVTNANATISSLFTTVGSGEASLTVVPLGHGQVTVSPRANVYSLNTPVTITATPATGQSFLGWSGSASGMQNPLSLTLTTNTTLYAHFSVNHSLSGQLGAAGFADGFVVDLNGEYGTNYELEVSSNLVDWTVLYYLTNTVGTIHYIDTNAASVGERFYRAVVP